MGVLPPITRCPTWTVPYFVPSNSCRPNTARPVYEGAARPTLADGATVIVARLTVNQFIKPSLLLGGGGTQSDCRLQYLDDYHGADHAD